MQTNGGQKAHQLAAFVTTLILILSLYHWEFALSFRIRGLKRSSLLESAVQNFRRKQHVDYLVSNHEDQFKRQPVDGVLVGFQGANSRLSQSRRPIIRNPYEGNVSYAPILLDEGEQFISPEKRKVDERHLAYFMSPISDQILEVGQSNSLDNLLLDRFKQVNGGDSIGIAPSFMTNDDCHVIRSNVDLIKDDIDKNSGQILRSCKGSVQLNRCDGSCTSSVQPSVKSPSGFKKVCHCCNEGSFKKVQVRLLDCYSTTNNRRISKDDGSTSESFMDIEIDEPVDCKCRSCDGQL